MFNKVYSSVRDYFKENIGFVLGLLLMYTILNLPLPYYIHTNGGLIDISSKVEIENAYKEKGSFNLSYVSEIKGTVMTYLISYILPTWDLVKSEEMKYENESFAEVDYRNQMLLEEANQNAIFLAYEKANKYINILNQKNYVVYIDELAETNLKIGDELIEINNQKIMGIDDYIKIIKEGNIGDTLNLKVKNDDNKIIDKYIKIISYESSKITGIYFITDYEFETKPKITLNFDKNESGPSGGLMMTLSIYNKLIKEDITHGKKIVGTGTIDEKGNVGQISGIEYKLKGAVNKGADIFFAPLEGNYDEALAIKEKNNYNIVIVGVATFNDALNYLNNM